VPIISAIRHFLLYLFLGAVVVLMAVSCAQVGHLGGGPKDKKPPVPLVMIPANYSNNFTGNKIEIKFDEFVKLEKINEQLLISPPVKEMPDFRLKGKSLVIKFKEELRPNTTYSMFFGDAIQDITEGNPLHNFTYIFSTGEFVDSLSMFGHVIGAFDLKPKEAVAVMLYRNNNDTIPFDSLPLLVPPYYLSRTDKEGNYFMTGLADDYYLVFALNDQTNNYIFDQPTEEIAFLDTLYHPVFIPHEDNPIDSVNTDTASFSYDSLHILPVDSLTLNMEQQKDTVADTTAVEADSTNGIMPVNLFMFLQKDTVMRLLEAKLIRLNTMRFIFSMPADSVRIRVDFKPEDVQWYAEEWSKSKDTLTWFLHEKAVLPDTFNILFTYSGDTLDYIYLPVKPREKKPGLRKKKKEEEKVHTLGFASNMKGNVKPGTTLYILFNQPLDSVGFDSVLFVNGEDSIYSPEYKFTDSLKRKMVFPYKMEPGMNYLLHLPDSCVKDWNGYYNKEEMLKFNSKELKMYGTLTLNLKPDTTGHYIVQLMNKKEKVLKEKYFTRDTTVFYEYLDPGDYLVKILFDQNGNRKWDTGDYMKGIEPEKVTYYGKLLNIRANWEIEESWSFMSTDSNPPPIKRK
jgi:hypothetical protein